MNTGRCFLWAKAFILPGTAALSAHTAFTQGRRLDKKGLFLTVPKLSLKGATSQKSRARLARERKGRDKGEGHSPLERGRGRKDAADRTVRLLRPFSKHTSCPLVEVLTCSSLPGLTETSEHIHNPHFHPLEIQVSTLSCLFLGFSH